MRCRVAAFTLLLSCSGSISQPVTVVANGMCGNVISIKTGVDDASD
jgi:hypothetical protein